MGGFGLLRLFAGRDCVCCRGDVITHQGETVCVGALLTFPVTSLLTFAVNQKHRKMAAAGDEGEGISAWNESAVASGLKRIPPKPRSPCKCSCNVQLSHLVHQNPCGHYLQNLCRWGGVLGQQEK